MYKVPYGINVSVEFIRDSADDNVRVKVIAPLYMRKEWYMPHSYSLKYSDSDILNDSDFITVLSKSYR